MKENKFNYKLINLTALMLLLYITLTNIGTWYSIFIKVVEILLPFIIAFAIAYALNPIVRWLEKQGIPENMAILLIVLVILVLFSLIIGFTLPVIYDQLQSLSKNIGSVLDTISDKIGINLAGYEKSISAYIKELSSDVGKIISTNISKSFGIIGNFIVGFVASIYFLAYMDDIKNGLKLFLKNRNKKLLDYLKVLDSELGNYLKGLLTFMIIEFIEYSILFKIVNHPNWLILGTLACLMTIIPYFGGLITNIIALLLASVTTPYTFIGTLIICLIFPQIDGYFTSPKVYGKTSNVNPLITIMAVSIGGTLAGGIGIAAALPVFILIRATFKYFKNDLLKTYNTIKETI